MGQLLTIPAERPFIPSLAALVLDLDQECGGREAALTGAQRPLDEQNAEIAGFVEAELVKLLRVVDAVEIGVGDRAVVGVVALHEGEGGRRHVDRLAHHGPDHRPGDLALADTQVALEQHDIALAEVIREATRKVERGLAGGKAQPAVETRQAREAASSGTART
jgi:hypothetical protein